MRNKIHHICTLTGHFCTLNYAFLNAYIHFVLIVHFGGFLNKYLGNCYYHFQTNNILYVRIKRTKDFSDVQNLCHSFDECRLFLVDWGSILEIYCYSIIKQYQRISHKNLKKKPWISVPSYLYLIRSTLTALTNKQFNLCRRRCVKNKL